MSAAEVKLQDMLMGDISKRRSCMYDMVTMNSEMENIVKDALERRSRTHLAQVIYSPFTMRSNAVVAKKAAHILLLASRCRTQ